MRSASVGHVDACDVHFPRRRSDVYAALSPPPVRSGRSPLAGAARPVRCSPLVDLLAPRSFGRCPGSWRCWPSLSPVFGLPPRACPSLPTGRPVSPLIRRRACSHA